jgi:excisionase family DNA binding protein
MMESQASGKSVVIGATLLEKELAEVLGTPVSTVKRMRSDGKIPYVKIGRGRVIYLAESVLRWLEAKEIREDVGGASETPLGDTSQPASVV